MTFFNFLPAPKTEWSYNQTTLTLFALNILDHILIYIKVPLSLPFQSAAF